MVKNPPTNAEDSGPMPGLGRSPREGHGNPLQYSCLENPMDRGARWAMVHSITKNRTQLKRLSKHVRICICVTDSLCCTPETNTVIVIVVNQLYSNKNKGMFHLKHPSYIQDEKKRTVLEQLVTLTCLNTS